MTELQKALEHLRPKDFGEVPTDDLNSYLSNLFSNAELIANSVPPPPEGTPFELSKRSRTDANGAVSAADLTISKARRPPIDGKYAELCKAWGKPLKLSAKDNATGISVFKMAGHDRHGAWFARTSVHEGLGFSKWKKAMMREFPESLEVQGGPGEGNVRGIGGDRRLEDISVPGIGKLEVYQLSAQFPGPTSPREFITLLLTSENGLSDASKVHGSMPRHYLVVSIPITHPDAPPRDGMVRGQYESVEMIREIPLSSAQSSSTSDLLKNNRNKSRDRGNTIGFAESRGPDAKGENIDRVEHADGDNPETNPVEWIMITRSDPGGGIPRFMVERNTPSSIVADAAKFLDWACSKDHFPSQDENEDIAKQSESFSAEGERLLSVSDTNGILAGVGTSIADNRRPSSFRRPSQRTMREEESGIVSMVASTVGAYVPDAFKPLQRSQSQSSTATVSSVDSFASAEQYTTAPGGLPVDDSLPTPSTLSEKSVPVSIADGSQTSREIERIEEKRKQLQANLDQSHEKQAKATEEASEKSAKELEKAAERHARDKKKQEDKYTKEVQKLEARRERETKKLLAKQQKEADKNALLKTQRERDEWKDKAELAEKENALLKKQIGELQRENTVLVARVGKADGGLDILRKVREDIEGKGRNRASSRASSDSHRSQRSGGRKSEKSELSTSVVENN